MTAPSDVSVLHLDGEVEFVGRVEAALLEARVVEGSLTHTACVGLEDGHFAAQWALQLNIARQLNDTTIQWHRTVVIIGRGGAEGLQIRSIASCNVGASNLNLPL